jgi:hypothetical protein
MHWKPENVQKLTEDIVTFISSLDKTTHKKSFKEVLLNVATK